MSEKRSARDIFGLRSAPPVWADGGGRAAKRKRTAAAASSCPEKGFLTGLRFLLVGFSPKHRALLEDKILRSGGTLATGCGPDTNRVVCAREMDLPRLLRILQVAELPAGVSVHLLQYLSESLKLKAQLSPSQFLLPSFAAAFPSFAKPSSSSSSSHSVSNSSSLSNSSVSSSHPGTTCSFIPSPPRHLTSDPHPIRRPVPTTMGLQHQPLPPDASAT
ncbi:MAG: hypothetical protein Q8P67_02135, partial [archaeon]|nr:hypothetical protein [archaeon]